MKALLTSSNALAVSMTTLAAALLLQAPAANAQPGAVNPPLLDCGTQGNAELVCGTQAPEDFEVTPDGKYLLIAKFGANVETALDAFNLDTHAFSALPMTAEKKEGWGDPACTESIGMQTGAHGLSLTQRTTGEWQLYVVNHRVRESMEMFELQPDGAGWKLVWRGCVTAQQPYNDVSALPDGGFVATRPTALVTQGQDIFAGAPTGNVARWSSAGGEQVLPGSEYGYPNGVMVSKDGRFAFVSGWTTRSFHRYDLNAMQETGRADFTFMPDNLTWTPDGKLIAAGIKGINGDCPETSDDPCLQGMVVAEVDPETLQVTVLQDNEGRGLINGTSVGIQVGASIYVGSFQGDRLVILPR